MELRWTGQVSGGWGKGRVDAAVTAPSDDRSSPARRNSGSALTPIKHLMHKHPMRVYDSVFDILAGGSPTGY